MCVTKAYLDQIVSQLAAHNFQVCQTYIQPEDQIL